MIKSIAFIAYPAKDVQASRRFYEGVLGLKMTHEFGGMWFEYDLGDATFALCSADADHPVPVKGAVVGFEVTDLDSEVTRLKQSGVKFKNEVGDTPVCRFIIALDPDGSEVMLHQRKA
jgi:predicted enzyme related to lactoylglutathione lyase